jgi:hypothetical protein
LAERLHVLVLSELLENMAAMKDRDDGSSSDPARPEPGSMVVLFNGAVAGLGGLYTATHSLLLVTIVGVVAVASLVVARRGERG